MKNFFIPRLKKGILDELQEEDITFAHDDEEAAESEFSSEDWSSEEEEEEEEEVEEGPLFEMANLVSQLPFKRGLSKHYQGKSQSFTSFANVRRVENLAKPEKTYTKKRYGGGGIDYGKALACAKTINKKTARRGSVSSLGHKRNDPTQRAYPSLRWSSGDLSGQAALLFA